MASESGVGDFCLTIKREVNKLGGPHRNEFVMNFSREGCMILQCQLGNWAPCQHSVEGRGNPSKTVSSWPAAGLPEACLQPAGRPTKGTLITVR